MRLILGVSALVLVLGGPARAERLAVKSYTTADGLAHDRVKRIVRDSHGFLWFCTPNGISRFDGERFVSYAPAQPVATHSANDLLETRDGTYWIGSNGAGLWRFAAKATSAEPFTLFSIGDEAAGEAVNAVFQDREGTVWLGTPAGLFRLDSTGERAIARAVSLGISDHHDRAPSITAFAQDAEGQLWAGSSAGLLRRRLDGRWVRYPIAVSPSRKNAVHTLLVDTRGRLWIGGEDAVLIFRPGPAPTGDEDSSLAAAPHVGGDECLLPEAAGQARRCTPARLAETGVEAMLQSRDGRVWLGGRGGLSEFDRKRFRHYTPQQGLSGDPIFALAEDSEGNLWMGTGSGAARLARAGIVSYGAEDGLGGTVIISLFQTRAGDIVASATGYRFHRWDGTRFIGTRPNLPRHLDRASLDAGPIAVEDRRGEWWVPTAEGLYRFPPVRELDQLARVQPLAIYASRDGLSADHVRRVYEDSRGDLWITMMPRVREPLTRWERGSGRFRRYGEDAGLPAFRGPASFAEDGAGQIWVGFWEGGLARRRGDRFTLFGVEDGLPAGPITELYADSAGRLWVASAWNGLYRIDDPSAERPTLSLQAASADFGGTNLECLAEDRGRLFIGTGSGLYRLDPQTRHLVHYTTADGLARNGVRSLLPDRDGALWVGTVNGVSRFRPEAETIRSPPPALIVGLTVAGASLPVSELGETDLAGLVLASDQNRIRIDFFGLSFAPSRTLRYQYRLEGADREWVAPTDVRSVHYAGLAPGSYRFLVRAVDVDGAVSPTPASVAFRVLSPVWQRWWFLTLAAALLAGAGYGTHRVRLARTLAVERVRIRIASDLHDDVGSTVSRMAVLSEVAKRQIEGTHTGAARVLDEIGSSARELLDTTGDIVWAIDPRRDDGASLVARIREFGAGLLEARGIAWDFEATPEAERRTFDPEQRRQLLLIFKEALHNIVRHAAPTSVSVTIVALDNRLRAEIRDDGRGFLDIGAHNGHGLASMRQRAARLGGALTVHSAPGTGTQLTLDVPLERGRA